MIMEYNQEKRSVGQFKNKESDSSGGMGSFLSPPNFSLTAGDSSSNSNLPIQRVEAKQAGNSFKAKVNTWGTAMRKKPEKNPNEIIADLPFGQLVDVLGGNYWIKIRTELNGKSIEGYVSYELIDKIDEKKTSVESQESEILPCFDNPKEAEPIFEWVIQQMKQNMNDPLVTRFRYQFLLALATAGIVSQPLQLDLALLFKKFHGEWDLKKTIGETKFIRDGLTEQSLFQLGDNAIDREVWSNIHFGFVGAATGLPRHFLNGGAGIASLLDLGKWEPFTDRHQTKIGFDMYPNLPSKQALIDIVNNDPLLHARKAKGCD